LNLWNFFPRKIPAALHIPGPSPAHPRSGSQGRVKVKIEEVKALQSHNRTRGETGG
jgi:hypothetical protein